MPPWAITGGPTRAPSSASACPKGRSRADRQVKAAIIAAALLERDGAHRRISYSRSTDFYAIPDRYRTTPYTRDRVCNTIDALDSAGFVQNCKASPGAHLHPIPERRLQSAFWATSRMTDALKGTKLDNVAASSPIILRDCDGAFVDFRDTERTRRLRQGVDEVNAGLKDIRVDVSPSADPADWARSDYHLRARKVRASGKATWATICPTTPHVVRIFSRESFDLHGRYYGFWQGLPKARRAELLINGELVIEPDFRWLHPQLLYAMAGCVIGHDPYTTGYWPRQAGKLAFNTYVNAPTLNQAIGALIAKRDEEGDDGEPVWKYGYRETARILDGIKAANRPIEHLFGSDAGVKLMSVDSGMAGAVMKACRKASIPCLPVHDSFIVPASKGATVEGIMASVLDATLVTIKSKVPGSSVKTFRHNETLASAEPSGEPSPERMGTSNPEGPGEPSLEGMGTSNPEGPGEPSPEGMGTSNPEGPGVPTSVGVVTLPAEPMGALSSSREKYPLDMLQGLGGSWWAA